MTADPQVLELIANELGECGESHTLIRELLLQQAKKCYRTPDEQEEIDRDKGREEIAWKMVLLLKEWVERELEKS